MNARQRREMSAAMDLLSARGLRHVPVEDVARALFESHDLHAGGKWPPSSAFGAVRAYRAHARRLVRALGGAIWAPLTAGLAPTVGPPPHRGGARTRCALGIEKCAPSCALFGSKRPRGRS